MTTALRADAQRNLARILEAATDVYAEVGPEATIDEIARRAGVGHGTVCRRFPTKDALRAAVIRARLDELAERARVLAVQDDAGAAFESFIWAAAETCRRDAHLFSGVEHCAAFPEVAEGKAQLHEVAGKLIRRAQRAGAIRRGLDVQDVGALVGATITAAVHAERDDAWKRYVRVLLDGLRA